MMNGSTPDNAPQRNHKLFLLGLVLVIAAGIFLRMPVAGDSQIAGFDERLYQTYSSVVAQHGVTIFPELCEHYLIEQKASEGAFLPPTRVLFLTTSAWLSRISGLPPLEAVRWVSALAACMTLLISATFAWRAGGPAASLAVTALVAFAPTQLHMAHRALIDGFFGCIALTTLWGLWECLQNPDRRGWLCLYGAGLAAMVLTKENALFAYVGLCGILVLNLWLKLGTARLPLYLITILAPTLGALTLVMAAGGPSTLIQVFRLNVEKSLVLPYAIATGDGPWFRYLLDLLLVSPFVLLLAISSILSWRPGEKLSHYFALFFIISYLVMCNVRYGMNLRYGNMWDMPLSWLAYAQIAALASRLSGRLKCGVVALAIAAICSLEHRQFNLLFVNGRIYDPTPVELEKRLQLIKTMSRPPVPPPESPEPSQKPPAP